MSQNKYFSPGRFARLFRNDLLINYKTYFLALAGVAIASYAFTFIFMQSFKIIRVNHNSYYIGPLMVLILVIWVVIGTSFPMFRNQIKASNYLLSPGSTFEKFMVQFFIRVVLFIPVAMFLFWVGEHLAKASMFADPITGFDPFFIRDVSFSNSFNHLVTRDLLAIVFSIFSVATLFFAGSICFKQFALIKTLIFLGIFIGANYLLFVVLSHIFYPHETSGISIVLKSYNVDTVWTNVQYYFAFVGGLSWLFFLPLAYFKLKEREA